MRRTRKLSCKNKVKHPNKKAAEDAMYAIARRRTGGIVMNTEVYKCGEHWHFGHYRRSKR